jgi:meiotically up-regulated gene 157 (Mug157) protein
VRDKGAAQVSSYIHTKHKGSSHCVIITRISVLKLINTTCKCDQYLLLVTSDATIAQITVIKQLIQYLLLIISKGRLMNAVNSHSAESAVKVN